MAEENISLEEIGMGMERIMPLYNKLVSETRDNVREIIENTSNKNYDLLPVRALHAQLQDISSCNYRLMGLALAYIEQAQEEKQKWEKHRD